MAELFFQTDRGKKMMVTSVRAEPELRFVEPRLLFEGRFLSSNDASAAYAVAADGRFLMVQAEIPGIASELVVVQNWLREIERLAPRTR